MLTLSEPSLRARLRTALDADHARLDGLFSRLDLTRSQGYAAFLSAQRAAFDAIRRSRPAGSGRVTTACLTGYVDALDRDLARLGRVPVAIADIQRCHPDAVDHVILGSRLGSRVLRGRWSRSTDPAVLSAGTYLSISSPGADWRAHCADLSARPADAPGGDALVFDVRALFSAFEEAYHAASRA